ncbi:hypothetical protein MYCTH_2309566 [Thermothelomyces thermophilus ATCC 42464]|uniref:Uncharacterized protein n=1 Tax=Thermothelomyces thermophilus (strain ATCC 42464 / BCRC 31852 / DSM 1799) TaxID=573729 RepID=G2QIQ8_THET4|nr:uncharacterized protein MYCTH_2309566 [Thermothelomyces thermophilus ATCC 42464]AEO60380.1 hypothetical protein MYCTH_2309566 [Thermothelomyces thermophilus ATCC 42464]
MPDGDQTNNGDYEYIDYHIFPPVEHERLLSWKAGTGSVLVAAQKGRPQKTDTDEEDVAVPRGNKVLVMQAIVKLVTKNA